MSSRTINGKNVAEIFAELEAPLEKEAIKTRDFDKMPYISVDTYRQRLDTVLGRNHYNEVYSEPNIMQVKSTYGVTTVCTLEFLDDDYNVIIKKESAGGKEISFANLKTTDPEDNSKKIDRLDEFGEKMTAKNTLAFGNDIACACQEAFKNVCKRLNIGTEQLEAAKAEAEKKAKGEEFTITFAKDATYGEKYMFCDISCKEAPEYKRLALFSSDMAGIKKVHPDGYKKGETIIILATKGKDNKGKPQLVMKGISFSGQKETENADNTNNTPFTKHVTTTGPVVEYENHPGNFMVQATDENGEAFDVFISKDTVERIGDSLWSQFVVKCAKEASSFSMECTKNVKNGKTTLVMNRFSK